MTLAWSCSLNSITTTACEPRLEQAQGAAYRVEPSGYGPHSHDLLIDEFVVRVMAEAVS